jgi:hypothetical protein
MATITPVSAMSGEVQTITWADVTTTTDTPEAYGPVKNGLGARRAAVTFGGTFGGATAVLQGSVDNVTYATLTDLAGNAVSATAAKVQEFSSSCLYFKPAVSGGTGDDVDIVMAMRA